MEIITLYTPLVTLHSDVFIITIDDITAIINFLLNRKKNISYLREYYKAYCILDMDFTLEGNVIVSKFMTESLVISKVTLLNMAFGSTIYRVVSKSSFHSIMANCVDTISPYIELPFYTESFKYYISTFRLKGKLENLLNMKVVIDKLDSRVYVGTYINPLDAIFKHGCYNLLDLAMM